MGVISNSIKRDELKPGDHIYSWRLCYVYSHHGIYVGDGKVIHFTPGAGQETGLESKLNQGFSFSSVPRNSSGIQCPICGDQPLENNVIASCLDCFLSGGNLYRFEYGVSTAVFIAQARGGTCTLAASDPSPDVLFRAFLLLENGFGVYNLLKNNCEDFAIYCKTGLRVFATAGQSGQYASFSAAVSSSYSMMRRVFRTNVAITAISVGAYCVNRYVSDIGVRSDVTKVPAEKLVADAKSGALEIPAHWEQVSINIIDGLPESEGYQAVLVVVDQRSKYAHFILLEQPCTPESIARVFTKEMVRSHGLPRAIISENDPSFMSELFKMQETETDAEMGAINRCLEHYIRFFAYEQPQLWSIWIRWAEFWYNTSLNESAGTTPFEAAYGKKPPTVIQGKTRNRVVATALHNRDVVLCKLQCHLCDARMLMKQQADYISTRNVVFDNRKTMWNVYCRTEEKTSEKRGWGI